MTTNTPSKTYILVSLASLIIGILAFAIGIFNAEMALNEKGYYVTVLLYGLYSMVSLQKTIRDRTEHIETSQVYYIMSWVSSIAAVLLLCVGLYNAELLLSEKGFYLMSYVLSLFAAITVQKNTRDQLLNENL